MANVELDALGLKCPQPILKVASVVPKLKAGDILTVTADCPTIEVDVRKWAARMDKTVLSVRQNGAVRIIQIQF